MALVRASLARSCGSGGTASTDFRARLAAVFVGDLLERLTHRTLRALSHRVCSAVAEPCEDRIAATFFLQPRPEQPLRVLPSPTVVHAQAQCRRRGAHSDGAPSRPEQLAAGGAAAAEMAPCAICESACSGAGQVTFAEWRERAYGRYYKSRRRREKTQVNGKS